MGMADVTAARIFANGPDGNRLSFETLSVIGYQSTHSTDSTVTDSAAAASAWATGEKHNNGEISFHDDDGDGACDSNPVPTILDIAQSKGKTTGLVATSDITHATPAAFGANVHSRKCEEEIAYQLLDRKINVLFGGGISVNQSPCLLGDSEEGYLDTVLAQYSTAGYLVVETKDAMDTVVNKNKKKIIELFKSGGKTQEFFQVDSNQVYPETEPTLWKMTTAALEVLDDNKKGFFLMVEGSQIDWASHANDVDVRIAETLAFDEAAQVVLDWINASKSRKNQTLIVVVADHETGDFAIDGPYGTLSEQYDIIEDGWTSGSHSAVDTTIWAQGPKSAQFGQALDNTDLYVLIKNAMK
jgi:alkaline phosphatase